MSDQNQDELELLTLKMSKVFNRVISLYADQNLNVSETDNKLEELIVDSVDIEEIGGRVLMLNGVQVPPPGVCPLKDLNDEIVDATEARGSNAADGIKKYMDLFRAAKLVAKDKSSERSDRIVRTEDFKEAAVNLDI